MAAHCRYCTSTDIEARITPSGINYFHCNECNRNFITPILDPVSIVDADDIADDGTAATENLA